MKETEYAYAVARTRAVEKRLLSRAFVEQLIASSDVEAALRLLRDNGWDMPEGESLSAGLSRRLVSAWDFLRESAPDETELEPLAVLNDYANVKAAVKCRFSGFDREKYYTRPTTIDLEKLGEAVDTLNFSLLSEPAAGTAKYAYKVAVETGSGQSTDIVTDIAALNRLKELADKLKSPLMRSIARCICAGADIKTAVRCAKTQKDEAFIRRSLCDCDGLEIDRLVAAALSGEQAVLEYVSRTEYADAATALKNGTTAFEKWCDDAVMSLIKKTKWQAFGLEPLIAYYYAVAAEVKCVRIILGAKHSGVSADRIRERVRELYV